MEKLLFVTKEYSKASYLQTFIEGINNYDTTTVFSIAKAKEQISTDIYSLVVINCPLIEEYGDDFALWVALNSSAGVVVFMKKELSSMKRVNLEDMGVFVASKPAKEKHIIRILRYTSISRNRNASISEENCKLQQRLSNVKVINKAKWKLVEKMSITEDDAHKYIERNAMNRHIKKADMAKLILKYYEDKI